MNLFAWSGIFVIALAALVKGADLFIGAAERIGRASAMPPFLIGVVLVGFGTSLPELVSSILAVTTGTSEIVVGNVLGSNITNVLLVLGPLLIPDAVNSYSMPVFVAVALLLVIMTVDRRMTRGEGAFLIAFYAFFVGRLFSLDIVLRVAVTRPFGRAKRKRPQRRRAGAFLRYRLGASR